MGAVLYNFTRWSFESDAESGAFRTDVDDARDYPEHLVTVGEGFIQYLAQHLLTGKKVEVTGSSECLRTASSSAVATTEP